MKDVDLHILVSMASVKKIFVRPSVRPRCSKCRNRRQNFNLSSIFNNRARIITQIYI